MVQYKKLHRVNYGNFTQKMQKNSAKNISVDFHIKYLIKLLISWYNDFQLAATCFNFIHTHMRTHPTDRWRLRAPQMNSSVVVAVLQI